jgi:type IV secretion system protein VirD4
MSTSGNQPPVSASPGEAVFVFLLAAAAGVGVVVWAGAALAAILVGASPPGGVLDAITALPGLAAQPGDPRAAWTRSGGRPVDLPSAAVYWTATIAVAVVVAVVVVAGRWVWRSMRPERRRLGVDARARFARRRELRPMLVRRPVPGRLILGRRGRWLVATESQRWDPLPTRGWRGWWAWLSGRRRRGRSGDVTSVAIIGPTRSGKTAECAIPAVLDWEGPAILLSVKRDLMDTTIARRRSLGQVRVFDPGGLAARNVNPAVTIAREELARWSPLRDAHTASGAKKAGEALAAWTPQAGVDGGMDFWTSQGKVLFTGLLGAAALSDRKSMHAVAEWVFNMTTPKTKGGCPPLDILRHAINQPATRDAADAAVLHLGAIWNKDDPKLQSSVYATATTVVTPWLEPNVIAATDLDAEQPGEWVDLDWLMDTGVDGDNANTLYLLVSHDDYQRLAPVLAGLLSDLKAQAYEWESIGRRFPAPLLMLIDEAGNMPLAWLPEVSSTCAGLGIQLVTIWQSLAQITESYGRRADVLLTNHATKLFFPAASDDSTLSYQSKIAGDEEIERQSWSSDLTAGGRRSISGQASREALVPYFLARLPRFGQALMIHSNTNPAQVTGRRWWADRRLAGMVPTGVANRHRPANPGRGPWHPTPTTEPAAAGPPPGQRDGRPPGVDPTTGELHDAKGMRDAC